ncbi:SDR family oxidoreductase [Burkholderia cenocepacia]|uniref:SDR family oxidoreductase n=1 Tax=Burkholderia cenocepacia TaxID=95486 RepID=A0A427NHJ7_9BURK|nr:SDR family oxidoreductase [Burkholderia cenocepacia]MBR8156388.1 SDR family oxidoreductase [Burkholderia cenocepacia]MCA8086595.1 SDR family oxidoreductase [Burkholderia cenocepacia]MCA8409168.1 SDR family oxidoreductase [Burkholderia cenocepacia]MDR5665205.1 SDR family oxidoreductase [Burkholderia cenocepacia]MDR5668218.1 SDR family oxidoreductase [Burkholderia cenocepacia]
MTSDFDSHSLKSKSVLIFGGTSGIGLAAAKQAKAAGASVTVVGFNPEGAEQVAIENGFAGWRSADVTRPETIVSALADIAHVDHLVLLAGTFVAGKVLDADVDYLRRAFDERVWAAVHTLRALGDRLAADASVTFISGVLADRPNAYGTAILASASAAMEALARGLVLELAPRRVNTVSPGTTDTPLLARTLGEGRDAYVDALKDKLPLHRLGTAEEVGAAVVFLMSNGSMNGETIHVDGGARLV